MISPIVRRPTRNRSPTAAPNRSDDAANRPHANASSIGRILPARSSRLQAQAGYLVGLAEYQSGGDPWCAALSPGAGRFRVQLVCVWCRRRDQGCRRPAGREGDHRAAGTDLDLDRSPYRQALGDAWCHDAGELRGPVVVPTLTHDGRFERTVST